MKIHIAMHVVLEGEEDVQVVLVTQERCVKTVLMVNVVLEVEEIVLMVNVVLEVEETVLMVNVVLEVEEIVLMVNVVLEVEETVLMINVVLEVEETVLMINVVLEVEETVLMINAVSKIQRRVKRTVDPFQMDLVYSKLKMNQVMKVNPPVLMIKNTKSNMTSK
ncbi:hypothetical protein NGRA_3155 [Nosema granulosis]|uniref:Uncharacterized protein n=1 Tax=Nosema granulosis TaxID=83296 RepID=A0A9P6GWR1_9MICR|nr:hypothetical protein NGRA_3155 [Nosema granulosis]